MNCVSGSRMHRTGFWSVQRTVCVLVLAELITGVIFTWVRDILVSRSALQRKHLKHCAGGVLRGIFWLSLLIFNVIGVISIFFFMHIYVNRYWLKFDKSWNQIFKANDIKCQIRVVDVQLMNCCRSAFLL